MSLVQSVQLWTIEQIVQLPLDKLVFVQFDIWATPFWQISNLFNRYCSIGLVQLSTVQSTDHQNMCSDIL